MDDVGFDYSRLLTAQVGAADSTVRRIEVESLLNTLNTTPGIEVAGASGSVDAAVLLNFGRFPWMVIVIGTTLAGR